MILDHQHGLLLMRNDNLGERNWRSDDCFKLIFSPIGKGKFQTKQKDLAINPGEFLILNPNAEHKQLQIKEEKFLVELNQSMIKRVTAELSLHVSDPEFALLSLKHPLITKWVTFMREFMRDNDDASPEMRKLFIDSSLTQLSILMIQHVPGIHQEELPTFHMASDLQRVIHALKESYEQDWSLDDMTKLSGISKFQFAHLFKQTTGLSPYSWLQSYRLMKSQILLTQTTSSILWIALQVGFKSVGSYNQLFKKVYGKTPTAFRNYYYRNK
ncbi:helix-turn-helix transcriptional regulator [Virgibacillus flavescens]|uniref:helix-turn-helix transcriptional regulator n=1 Tax=Virgibacillus flavescens TaxID=1611422 RepID=UPI003D3419E3